MTFADPNLLFLLLAIPVALLIKARTGEGNGAGGFSNLALLSGFRPTWRLRYRWLPTSAGSAFAHGRETPIEIGDQIARAFKPDRQPHAEAVRGVPARGRPACCRSDRRRIERRHEALETAPAEPDAEQIERIDEARARGLLTSLEDETQQPTAAGKVAQP